MRNFLKHAVFSHRAMYEVEKEGLCQSLDKLKRDHEHYVKEINADITTTRERYTQLRQEVLHTLFFFSALLLSSLSLKFYLGSSDFLTQVII